MATAQLDRDNFQQFLLWLHPDEQKAGRVHEDIRFKLCKFFEWRGCTRVEECTDIAMDRVMAKVVSGEEIRTSNQYLYFLGVARHVLQEYWKKQKQSSALDDVSESNQPALDPKDIDDDLFAEEQWQKRKRCLKSCLNKLSETNRALITGYYQGERREKIKNRQRLAEWLNLSENALRLRTHRIRDGLDVCVSKCMEGRET